MSDLGSPHTLDDGELAHVRADLDLEIGGEPAGRLSLRFWPETAPATVRNFLRYCAEGFYDGLGFHRVIEGFMMQGGCPLGTGSGSGPHGTIPGEFSTDPARSHRRGVISMARSSAPDSASCQFFICHADAGFLDGQYAAFGEVEEGIEVVDRVCTTPCGPGGDGARSRPLAPVRIAGVHLRLAGTEEEKEG